MPSPSRPRMPCSRVWRFWGAACFEGGVGGCHVGPCRRADLRDFGNNLDEPASSILRGQKISLGNDWLGGDLRVSQGALAFQATRGLVRQPPVYYEDIPCKFCRDDWSSPPRGCGGLRARTISTRFRAVAGRGLDRRDVFARYRPRHEHQPDFGADAYSSVVAA